MDLLSTIMNAAGSGGLEQLGSQFGLDNSSVKKVLGQVVPALGQGMSKGSSSVDGLGSLVGALQNGNHQKYLGDVSRAASAAGVQEGNGILGHVFGSKDVSRNVAAAASGASGVSPDIIKKMLPVLATMAMGALSKETNSGSQLASGSNGGGVQDMLTSFLDSNNDGSAVDDVLNLAKKFF